MMGKSHRATGGAFAWWAALGAELLFGLNLVQTLAIGGCLWVLARWAVMWADLDHASSTATYSGGRVTELLAEDVNDLSCWVFDKTATPLDRKLNYRYRTHRGFTHAAIVGWLVGALLALLAGGLTWGAATIWGFDSGWALVAGLIVLVGIGGGMATHGAGDAWTNSGCAYLWPLKIRGQRFYAIRVPQRLRLSTGQGWEPKLVPGVSGVLAGAAIFLLIPGAWAMVLELLRLLPIFRS